MSKTVLKEWTVRPTVNPTKVSESRNNFLILFVNIKKRENFKNLFSISDVFQRIHERTFRWTGR